METFAPPSASRAAAARPMPREAPVTSATLFSKSLAMRASSVGRTLYRSRIAAATPLPGGRAERAARRLRLHRAPGRSPPALHAGMVGLEGNMRIGVIGLGAD